MNDKQKKWGTTLAIAIALTISGCDKQPENQSPNTQTNQTANAPISIKHALGTTNIDHIPQRVAVLDMNEADFLDQLNIPIAGMPKDFIPHFLDKYKNDANIIDLGSIVQPNMERIHALKPDLILMTPIQADKYKELSELAPTIHYDINFNNSQNKHIETVKNHLTILGQIFNRADLAQEKMAELDNEVKKAKEITSNRPEKALVVLHNNGSFSNFGIQSRYGFIFNDLGVKPASAIIDTNLHGQPISSEFIKKADPDILYIVDRTAVMEHRPIINAENVSNPLLRETKAWKNGHVVFVDADAWYITGASPTSLKILINDVLKGYQK